jgi:membrane protease YdiL (CAAX protease family)
MNSVRGWLHRALWEVVPRDHRETPTALRRRQVVTAAFVVLGGIVLGISLRIERGSAWFYAGTVGLAAVWTIGAFLSGPLHLGRIAHTGGPRRPVVAPILLGLGLAGHLLGAGLPLRSIAFLAGRVPPLLPHPAEGSVPLLVVITAVNGVAEELFFRGAAYAAVTRYPVPVTTVAYAIATLATGNVMLSFAAVLLGLVVGLQRRASGGILGPILTHVTWSLAMLLILPTLFGT